MGAMNGWILSMKVVLISAGVLSLAMALKMSIPAAVSGAPALWPIVATCMKPPYLYIVINGIIITIAASSRFHQSKAEAPAVRSDHSILVKTPSVATFESILAPPIVSAHVAEPAAEVVVSAVEERGVDLTHLSTPVVVNGSKVDEAAEMEDLIRGEAEDVFDESSLPNTPPRYERTPPEAQFESLLPVREKPLASSRFVNRKPNRVNPEVGGARTLRRVARPKKQETLESTWKMITEGRHVPLTRHLKKSETWEHHAPPPVVPTVPKSETFKERSTYAPPPPPPMPAKIRKEPSLGQDELNRRVEAFINKFNEDMRMQRQESLNQFMEMINRGV